MNDSQPMVGIDVGSATAAVVVARPDGDQLQVLGCGQARHDGSRKGIVANLQEVSEAIRMAAEEAEAMAAVPVERAVVGIGGTPILGVRSTASVPITGRDHTVTDEDQQRALEACAQVSIPPDYRVLDIIPSEFALDGQAGVDHPVGLPGVRLDATAFVLYTPRTHADMVEQAVNRAAVAVRQLVYEPLAAAEAVLTTDERDLGCLVIDIGYATTEWALILEHAMIASGAVPIGGRHFTSDLATVLNTTTASAEQLKRDLGANRQREGLEDEAVEIPTLGGDGNQVHAARFAVDVLHERARELLIAINQQVMAEGLERAPRSGLVLTGGGARLDGLEELAEVIFGRRARLGTPRQLTGIVEPVSGPEWAVACGLIRLQHRRDTRVVMSFKPRNGILGWLRNALGELFEMGGGM